MNHLFSTAGVCWVTALACEAAAATNGIPGLQLELGQHAVVSFPCVTGAFYRVDCQDALASGEWVRLAELTAPHVSTRLTYVDLRPKEPSHRFYRVSQVEPHDISTNGPDFFAYSVTQISNGSIEGTGGYGSDLTHFSLGISETGPRLVTAASVHLVPATDLAYELYFSGLNATNIGPVPLGGSSGASCSFTVYSTESGSADPEVQFITSNDAGQLNLQLFDPATRVITGTFDLQAEDRRGKLVRVLGSFRYTWTGTP